MTSVTAGRTWARITQTEIPRGWVLICDLCSLRAQFYTFWPASRSLRQHIAMHEETEEET